MKQQLLFEITKFQETGIIKVAIPFTEEMVDAINDLSLVANLSRQKCVEIESEIEELKKFSVFSFSKRKEKRKKIAKLINKKRNFVIFTNFFEFLEILEGEILEKQIYTEDNRNKVVFRMKLKEKEGIQFISIFLLTYPECIFKE